MHCDHNYSAHPKIAALTDREYRVWHRLREYADRLHSPYLDDAGAAEVPQLTPRILERFVELGLLDRIDKGYVIHNWEVWNGETPAERVAAFLVTHPEATSSDVMRSVRGRRSDVLAALKELRS